MNGRKVLWTGILAISKYAFCSVLCIVCVVLSSLALFQKKDEESV